MTTAAGLLRRWAGDVGSLLLPAGCLVCGAWLPRPDDGRLTCGPCRSRLPAAPWPRCPRCHHPMATGRAVQATCRECEEWPEALARARWAWVMAEPATTLVHGLKYEGWSLLAREMGAAMVSALGREGVGPSAVVAVPTTRARERRRGYNQARLLAEVVARTLAIPLAPALVRGRGGPTQVSLPPSERRANVRGAFLPAGPPGPHLKGARVLLVDDVLTTGATAGEAATVLREMGASEVTVLAFARALPSRRDAS